MDKIVVMGGGSWGTALAILLAEKGNEVVLWEFDEKKAELMQNERENKIYMPGIKFPDNLIVTNEIENLLEGVNFLVFSVPSQFLRNIVLKISSQIRDDIIIVNTGKGIEIKSHKVLSDVIKEEILSKFHNNIVVLSGPTHAEEVVKKLPSAIVAASKDKEKAQKVQNLFSTDYFRVYVNTDMTGVELGGALKNCIAIASGISDGMGFGDNSRAAIITRGSMELIRFGKYYGADFKTFSGLAGMGDLIVTCTSKHSRNRYFGEELGRGKTTEEILNSMVMVAEGVPTVKAVYEISLKKNIEMPIIESLYKIIYEKLSPDTILKELMGRSLKEEFYL